MTFCVSDDFSTQDWFSWGATPGGTYTEGLRVYANGQMVGQGTITATNFITGSTDLNGLASSYNAYVISNNAALSAETLARQNADTALQTEITAIQADYVTTDTAQTITASKTFTGGVTIGTTLNMISPTSSQPNKIVNLANGVQNNDAVNVGQLNGVRSWIKSWSGKDSVWGANTWFSASTYTTPNGPAGTQTAKASLGWLVSTISIPVDQNTTTSFLGITIGALTYPYDVNYLINVQWSWSSNNNACTCIVLNGLTQLYVAAYDHELDEGITISYVYAQPKSIAFSWHVPANTVIPSTFSFNFYHTGDSDGYKWGGANATVVVVPA